jgi:protein-S-isoprenylcysteine O-methyltransferase Ste14
MYLGMMIMLVGTWIALGSLSPVFVIPVFFLIIQEGFIKYEETFMEENFGDAYLNYKDRVNRWIGWQLE